MKQSPLRHWPKVTIVTVNYNGTSITYDLLKSLRRCTYPNFEIIVVDNGSSQESDSLKDAFPEITLLKTGVNLGFAGGNNAGFQIATGDYFLLLNNDTEVDPNFLYPLITPFLENPKIGCTSAKLIYHHTPGIIQYAGSTGLHPITGRGFSLGFGQKDSDEFSKTQKTKLAHGAAMMVSRKVMKEIGMMADLYFLYYEEVDYCERIKRAGYEIWYCGESTVYHKESMSVGKSSPLKTYYLSRNRLLFIRRNTKGATKIAAIFYTLFIAYPKNFLTLILKKEWKNLKPFLRGIFWNFTNFNIHQNPGLSL